MQRPRSKIQRSASATAKFACKATVVLALRGLASCGGNAGLAEGAECAADAACASGFCDVGSCATPNPAGSFELYGRACEIMPYFAPSGLANWGGKPPVLSECNHLCLDGVCRSCSSDAQCYEITGHPSCAGAEGNPGRSCGESPNPSEALFHPPDGVVRPGTPLTPVAQTVGVPGSVRLSFESPSDSAANARLAVVWWHQRAGEFDEFLQIAYDTALDPGATEMEIAFSDVALPYQENLICWRKCRDRTRCACRGYEFALGSVLVALDRDEDGALSFEEVQTEQIGAAGVDIGWAANAQGRGDDFDFIGAYLIPTGFSAYARPNAQPAFAPVVLDFSVVRSLQQTPAPDPIADRVFPMTLCPSGDEACSLPVTHVFCNRNCGRNWGLNRFGF